MWVYIYIYISIYQVGVGTRSVFSLLPTSGTRATYSQAFAIISHVFQASLHFCQPPGRAVVLSAGSRPKLQVTLYLRRLALSMLHTFRFIFLSSTRECRILTLPTSARGVFFLFILFFNPRASCPRNRASYPQVTLYCYGTTTNYYR